MGSFCDFSTEPYCELPITKVTSLFGLIIKSNNFVQKCKISRINCHIIRINGGIYDGLRDFQIFFK